MKKAVRNAAYDAFLDATGVELGTRIKQVRTESLVVSGRAHTKLFARGDGGGRPHPRLSFSWPPAVDPSPPSGLFAPSPAPASADELRTAIEAARKEHAAVLAGEDLDDGDAAEGGAKFRRNSVRVQRVAALFADVRASVAKWRQAGTLQSGQRACDLVIAGQEAEAFGVSMAFDDIDTGTYHSFGKDAPFVHYLEDILGTLPEEGSESMALLASATRESVRRQRTQARAHLDYLMREKYSYELPNERDIEATVGGFLIDTRTRKIASVVVDSDPIAPEFELLRIEPSAEHEHRRKWVYRDGKGGLHLQDHTSIEVDAGSLRAAPVSVVALTFRRAPKDPALRSDIPFDWDGNGYIDAEPIGWVSWAGHCDVKAVLEQLGLTLSGTPSVSEFRSDTGQEQSYNRDRLLEMVASAVELGSMYRRIDGTGWTSKGIHQFGGARNDSRPDRLQFAGPGRGKSFRWPRSGDRGSFVVESITWADGSKADMGTVFFRHLPDREATRFSDNDRFLRVVEGDYNVIDVTGARVEASIQVDVIDPKTGLFGTERKKTSVEFSADARPEGGRFFLGTEVADAAERLIYEVYYEPANNRIVGELQRWEKSGDEYTPTPVPERKVSLPMISPLGCTLSREMKRDQPGQFLALLDVALREGKNICADTDKEAEVWNGVVTAIDVEKVAENREERTEHWRVGVDARFGSATLDYLLRRNTAGRPEAFCPAIDDTAGEPWPDFLWHDVPDVGTKAFEDGDWLVNDAMWERGVVDVRPDDSVPSGFYVYDDHVKNMYELIFCGLAGYAHTIVHGNKRYGFKDEAAWRAAVDGLTSLRSAVGFEDA